MAYYTVVDGFGQDGTGKNECQMFCYKNKGEDFDACRELPVGKDRNDCFADADLNLKNCLGKCGPLPKSESKVSGSAVAVAAAIAAAALLLR